MDRKLFLQSLYAPNRSSNASLKGKASSRSTASGLNPYSGPWTSVQAAHLLKRCTFGSTYADITTVIAEGMSTAVNSILNLTNVPLPSPPVKDYTTYDSSVAPGTTWINTPITNDSGSTNSRRVNSFKKWWIGLMIDQNKNIREKMTLFWHNHFGTETEVVQNGRLVYDHNTLMRQNCLGNFKTMVRDVSVDAYMLMYLNGNTNTKNAPNENYARELLELFTLGKGPNSQYTQGDVEAAARVLTGWRVSNTNFSVSFDSTKHDITNKVFSPFFNSTQINGQSGTTAGGNELNDLLNMIFLKDEVAKYICRRLYRFFVYYEINSAIETQVIEPLAQIFITNNYEIKPVMEALLKSEHFYDANVTIASVIKAPLDFVLGLVREFKIPLPNASDYTKVYGHCNNYANKISELSQTLADPPNVSGWSAYYQEPAFHELWINATIYSKRVAFVEFMMNSGYTVESVKMQIDVLSFAQSLSDPSDPNVLISDILSIIYSAYLSPADISALKTNTLLGGQSADYYWTNAWNEYTADPNDVMKKSSVKTKLTNLLLTLLKREEYQLS